MDNSGCIYALLSIRPQRILITVRLPPRKSDISGIYSPWDEMLRGAPLPQVIDAVLIPFENKIICDSVIVPYRVRLVGQMRSSMNEHYFYAQFQRISARRGKKRAYVAVAHSMLIAIYHILKDNIPFVDLGSEYYNQLNKERKINVYLKKLKAIGWESDTAAVSLPA